MAAAAAATLFGDVILLPDVYDQVKLPDDVMLEADTTLATLAPIIKSGGVMPER